MNPATQSQGITMAAWRQRMKRAAFTLIELLVVIAIIAALAALVLPLSAVATAKMRTARVQGELNNYLTAIESYKLEVGQYPPDNGALRTLSAADPRYKTNAAMNPLYYELSGAIFTNKEFRTVKDNERVNGADLMKYFNREGIVNSARDKADIPYKGFSFRQGQFQEIQDPSRDVEIIAVPVPGPFQIPGKNGRKINPWFYDASSTNRHNRNSFDLWAEITIGSKTNVLSNWRH